ncbi:MAG: hypothetical protein ACI8QS_000873 [Planctomycetota bacterium]|jgi:hypothetical protein
MPSWANQPPPKGRSQAAGSGAGQSQRVDCFKCRHLSITHQREWPYACALFKMRSRMLPSIEVHKNSGSPCQGFAAKLPRE